MCNFQRPLTIFIFFLVRHEQLHAINKTGQTKTGSQERLTATRTRLINTSLQPTPCQTGKGDTSYVWGGNTGADEKLQGQWKDVKLLNRTF